MEDRAVGAGDGSETQHQPLRRGPLARAIRGDGFHQRDQSEFVKLDELVPLAQLDVDPLTQQPEQLGLGRRVQAAEVGDTVLHPGAEDLAGTRPVDEVPTQQVR